MFKTKRRWDNTGRRIVIPIINPILDQFWVDARLFLEESGYRIPSKFNPDWKPTNEAERRQAISRLPRPFLISAVRLKDNVPVILKSVEIDSPEFEISVLFSSPPLSLDPRNHCIPVYGVLKFGSHAILILPILRLFWDPPFDTVGEVLECFRQIFEGVQFMHQHFVAHRDCTIMNVMMDPTKMYPEGYIPERPYMKVDCSGHVSPSCTRTACWPRYYLIDFGHARRYDPADGIPSEPILRGADRTAPEHSKPVATFECNPFPTDIYYLGNMLREYFLDTKAHCNPTRIGLDFLRPLVTDMVKENPSERPTIDDVPSLNWGINHILFLSPTSLDA
ncbi:uncharacterized protein ARMOST_21744 [Armillaria ostoyae]|uniref:Protein kinase domain-containing protein n=1 Tax=Armillaria ostoyae TaxID=47428 RepID=A0A284SAZ3_ARMOS|nr:uncharacterized protein ARMOST_21744 [Armillaria ostoyae]